MAITVEKVVEKQPKLKSLVKTTKNKKLIKKIGIGALIIIGLYIIYSLFSKKKGDIQTPDISEPLQT